MTNTKDNVKTKSIVLMSFHWKVFIAETTVYMCSIENLFSKIAQNIDLTKKRTDVFQKSCFTEHIQATFSGIVENLNNLWILKYNRYTFIGFFFEESKYLPTVKNDEIKMLQKLAKFILLDFWSYFFIGLHLANNKC